MEKLILDESLFENKDEMSEDSKMELIKKLCEEYKDVLKILEDN